MRFLLAICALSLTAACSGSSGSEGAAKPPSVDAFTEGTCRTAAPDVLALGAATDRLGDGRTISPELKTELREAQAGLAAVAEAAEPAYKPALDRLVEATGSVRIRADGNVYEPSLGEAMEKAYRDAVDACT
jgi:hypothetical protein